METLFNHNQELEHPLADRMRPKDFDEFFGQEKLVGEGQILKELIKKDQIPSMVFWGPPGSGKTTLAYLIAEKTKSRFIKYSAVTNTSVEAKKIMTEAIDEQKMYGRRTILFIDEIHRFNKAQQAVFLPFVESGAVILIGATTENPSLEIISPLLSRVRVFALGALPPEAIGKIIKRALTDKKNGLGKYKIKLDKKAVEILIQSSNGDARVPLNALEIAIKIVKPDKQRVYHLSAELIKEALQYRNISYDKLGDEHYNVVSAFIKSMRGGDPSAAVYYLARMIVAGENPRFIVRRMIIFASEDIGDADPKALLLAISAAQAVEFVGLPEVEIVLSHVAIYLATTAKSNRTYQALLAAKEDVEKYLNLPVPLHLRNAVTPLLEKIGYGKDYLYPHNFPDGKVEQVYLPASLRNKEYYRPEHLLKNNKKEKDIKGQVVS